MKMNNNLFKKLEKILRCPRTGEKLLYDEPSQCFRAANNGHMYPIVDGILVLLAEEFDESTDHYLSWVEFYEQYMASPSFFQKIMQKVVWGRKDINIMLRAVDFIPCDFDGVLLDVPVGPGNFTLEKYKNLPNATIILLDYSFAMIKCAHKRYSEENFENILYIQADVGNLPFLDQTIDLLFTMNGYHAFPEKKDALDEIARVLKSSGKFSGCFYVKGERWLTDKFINGPFTKSGSFIPPYFTKQEIFEDFGKYFEFNDSSNINANFFFDATRILTGETK
jgi:ubiquinone/menaquinone biosynthesis C-methylase UbiE/uncharacterized protein YbaR (Trm112 family)